MARINTAAYNAEGQSLFLTVIATLSVMLGMIFALVGIKLWWFKHRLTFDQSSTRNGAAGGSQPTVVRQHGGSRDNKRLSMQISEPVVVHGVFRKRQEDEVALEPPQQLPPVGLRSFSQSTPNLIPPPRRLNKTRNALFEESQPPTRAAPRPPVGTTLLLQTDNQHFKKMETQTTEKMENVAEDAKVILEPIQAPRHLHRSISSNVEDTAKICSVQQQELEEEKRSTELFKASVEELQRLQHEKAEVEEKLVHKPEETHEKNLADPKSFFKIEELEEQKTDCTSILKEKADVDDLEDFREKWHTLQVSTEENPTQEDVLQKPNGYQYENLFGEKQSHRASSESVELTFEDVALENLWFKRNLSCEDKSLFKVERPTSYTLPDESFNNSYNNQAQLHGEFELFTPEIVEKGVVKIPQETAAMIHSSSEPAKNSDEFWEDEEKMHSSDEYNDELMPEVQNVTNTGFDFNIEEEFNKVRHTYEENEADFLEGSSDLVKFESEANSELKPQGFGKSIDEDWESFESLENKKTSTDVFEVIKTFEEPKSEPTHRDQAGSTELMEFDDTEDNTSFLTKEKRSVAYVSSIEELYDDLETEDDQVYGKIIESINLQDESRAVELVPKESVAIKNLSTSQQTKRESTAYVLNIEELYEDLLAANNETLPSFIKPLKITMQENSLKDAQNDTVTSILKEHRRPQSLILDDSDQEVESIEKAMLPKRQQKVTFDSSVEEHYLTADSQDSDDSDIAPETPPPPIPKPMQRMTNTCYNEDYEVEVNERIKPALPMVPSRKRSNEDPERWSPIREHPYTIEEYHHHLTSDPIVLSVPKEPPPQPAYRHAVPTIMEEVEENFIRPRTMRDMKKLQARQLHRQFSLE